MCGEWKKKKKKEKEKDGWMGSSTPSSSAPSEASSPIPPLMLLRM